MFAKIREESLDIIIRIYSKNFLVIMLSCITLYSFAINIE